MVLGDMAQSVRTLDDELPIAVLRLIDRLLRRAVKVASEQGNSRCNDHLHGMANGMILALAIIDGQPPEYLPTPDEWMTDLKVLR
jgi:hypothetical protein